MKKLCLLAVILFATMAFGDEITFTFLNFNAATFSATPTELQFNHAVNVLVTDNTNGHSMTLTAVDSGDTGPANDFNVGPPLTVDYSAAGRGSESVLVVNGPTAYLIGTMDDGGRLAARYPNGAGAFLSRFTPHYVNPAILVALDSPPAFTDDGSVSLTLAQSRLNGTTLDAVLGGGSITIQTQPIPEPASLPLLGSGLLVGAFAVRRKFIS